MTLPPAIRVDSIRKLVDDGNHNGFTDMCRFRGRIYLAYRSNPRNHRVEVDSSIVILASDDDGGTWTQAHRIAPIPWRDLRDPHFVLFRDALFVYSGAWIVDPETGGHDISQHVGYAAWTADGATWQGPQVMEDTFGLFIWRGGASGDKAYLSGKWRRHVDLPDDPRGTHEGQTVLLESTDGLHWTRAGVIENNGGTEVAFMFEADGHMLAIIRRSMDSQLGRSSPPYSDWTYRPLGRFIGGPMIARWGGHHLVGGRKRVAPGQHVTSLAWLVDDQLVDAVDLPSGGDTSYPGFVPLDDGRGLLSYYSSHQGSGSTDAPAHIYLAEISLAQA